VAGAWSRLQVLGQANLTYIIAQDAKGLVLVDQHAAHERVAYERLMRAWMSGQVEVQPLLLPITVDLEADGAEALMSIAHELEKLGVQIDQVGPQAVAIRSMPVAIKEPALAKALGHLAAEMVERGGSFALEKKISDLCATMACHSVVRAGQALSVEQMKSLLVQMDEFPLSSFCPHGRPVSVEYPFARLERDFGRLV
jgi:DNA mismatch repair protein MutL